MCSSLRGVLPARVPHDIFITRPRGNRLAVKAQRLPTLSVPSHLRPYSNDIRPGAYDRLDDPSSILDARCGNT